MDFISQQENGTQMGSRRSSRKLQGHMESKRKRQPVGRKGDLGSRVVNELITTTCPKEIVNKYEDTGKTITYDVLRSSDGTAKFFFSKSGKYVGSGHHKGDNLNSSQKNLAGGSNVGFYFLACGTSEKESSQLDNTTSTIDEINSRSPAKTRLVMDMMEHRFPAEQATL